MPKSGPKEAPCAERVQNWHKMSPKRTDFYKVEADGQYLSPMHPRAPKGGSFIQMKKEEAEEGEAPRGERLKMGSNSVHF